MDEHGIALGTILKHLQAMDGRMQSMQLENKRQFEDVKHQFHLTNQRIDRLERHLTRQIDAIDERFDAIEIEYLPKRVSAIEKHLHLAA